MVKANEARRAELAITISYPKSTNGMECCYWDGIVRDFYYFFCRQLNEHVFFSSTFLLTKLGFPQKKIMPSHICGIAFHIRSESPDTQVRKDRLTNRIVAVKLVKRHKTKGKT